MNIFHEMADIIEWRGKAKSTLLNEEGECCLLGAMALAKGEYVPSSNSFDMYDNEEDRRIVEKLYTMLGKDSDIRQLAKAIIEETGNYGAIESFYTVYRFSDNNDQDTVVDFLRSL